MKVFISYAREDQEHAQRLYDEFKGLGWVEPWWDQEDLFGGMEWEEVIFQAMEEADAAVILLSRHSVSKTGFVQKEVRFAVEQALERPPAEPYLIPARLDDCKPQLRQLRKLQWTDLFPDWIEGFTEIVQALEHKRAQEASPSSEGQLEVEPEPDEAGMPLLAPRKHLIEALQRDLIGPYTDDEVLDLPPSRFYLTGFLAPEAGRDPEDPESEEDLQQRAEKQVGEEPDDAEPVAKRKNRLPASMGLSVFLPSAQEVDRLTATVEFADYVAEPKEDDESRSGRPQWVWRRNPRIHEVEVPLDPSRLRKGVPIAEDEPQVVLQGLLAPAPSGAWVAEGTRVLSLFLVNRRPVPPAKDTKDEAFLFQVRLELTCEAGFRPRHNRRDESSKDWDDRTADLQFRDEVEWAVGHGVSTERGEVASENALRTVRTTWLPSSEVRTVKTLEEAGVEVRMEELADLTAGSVHRALGRLPEAYGEWIEKKRKGGSLSTPRAETRRRLMDRAEEAKRRIEEGIALLERDDEVLEAFRLANRSMAWAARQRNPERYEDDNVPVWRLFQLAFVLQGLAGAADPEHPDRETVDLIFFPTGGGKTEAYLGLIAVTLVLRRLRGRSRPDQGLGLAVLLRYTLRLLTLDQLARAATLICALELLRRDDPERLGEVRFSVGLWVGGKATPNYFSELRRQLDQARNQRGRESPCPLTDCPWCQTELGPDEIQLEPSPEKPEEAVLGCKNFRCEFSRGGNPEGLPVLFVDEQIYRELPSFLVATVDKFALLPWRGETGKLFGRATHREGRRFYGPADARAPSTAEPLPEGLRPPELIVQDELHLISGPLGTMVGLYETAIETLCLRDETGREMRPKIVAATATVRRAAQQIQALYGREHTAIFPPPGVDANETYFATVDTETPGRRYVGVAAPGRAMKSLLWRVYVTLLAAGQYALETARGNEEQTTAADALTTLVGYFNSLRELGGMRRLVEDEVGSRVRKIEQKRPENLPEGEPHPWGRSRSIDKEPLELTSRVTTTEVARARRRLEEPHGADDHVDVILASNMISVGVDVDRLGLMVVAGQPKTTSEYIQATSRVGRAGNRPGLVVTCLQMHRPRDRSHYERFVTYHESFYRDVEVSSVTPFSGPALDRGLAGVSVALARLLNPELTSPDAAMDVPDHPEVAEAVVARLVARALAQPGISDDVRDEVRAGLERRGRELFERWHDYVERAEADAYHRTYSPWEGSRESPLLRTVLDAGRDPAPGFTAPTSMRDVEPSVHLWVDTPGGETT